MWRCEGGKQGGRREGEGKGGGDGWQVGVGSELLVTVPPPLGLANRISPALLRRCCYGWCGARRFDVGMGEWGGLGVYDMFSCM